MLYYSILFLIVALIAAAFGFRGISSTAGSIAKVLFFIFLIIFVATLGLGLFGVETPF